MEDFQVVSFMDLLSQCVTRCVVDWRCFRDRQQNDESFVGSHVRNGIIQFCRAQREIFLKLYLLSQFMKEQDKLDRILEKMYSYENYLNKCGGDIAMNLRKVQSSDLLVACPNTALAVDLLSSGKYTRMPLMLPQLAESAITNAVPLPPLSMDEADLTMSRLNEEYQLQFQRSKCKSSFSSIECRNGHCIITKEGFFSVTLVYDFFAWQALAAVPLLLEQFGCSTEGEARGSFLTLIIYEVALHNRNKRGNIFDDIFSCANLYCGKLIMEKLKSQAMDYKALRLTVSEYSYHTTNDPDQMLLSCSDVKLGQEDSLVLEALCFPGFRYSRFDGLTIKFEMDHQGNIRVGTVEIPEMLSQANISEHRLDKWLEVVAELLERYQLDILDHQGNVFMNHATGALNIVGLTVPFSLAESASLIRAMEVRNMFLKHDNGLSLVDAVPSDVLWRVWSRDKCDHCEEEVELVSPKAALTEQQKNVICDFWHILEDGQKDVHGVACYLVKSSAELETDDIAIYLTLMSHNVVITGSKLIGVQGSELLGVVELNSEYNEYQNIKTMVAGFMRFAREIHDLGEFWSRDFGPADQRIIGATGNIEFSINRRGECDAVIQGGIENLCNSSGEAVQKIRFSMNGQAQA